MRGSGYYNVCLPFLAVWLVATSYTTTQTTAPQCQLRDSRAQESLTELRGPGEEQGVSIVVNLKDTRATCP
jgi:hypothetical protein